MTAIITVGIKGVGLADIFIFFDYNFNIAP
jgi:hypothetical protein